MNVTNSRRERGRKREREEIPFPFHYCARVARRFGCLVNTSRIIGWNGNYCRWNVAWWASCTFHPLYSPGNFSYNATSTPDPKLCVCSGGRVKWNFWWGERPRATGYAGSVAFLRGIWRFFFQGNFVNELSFLFFSFCCCSFAL